jgi:hypothetical protein
VAFRILPQRDAGDDPRRSEQRARLAAEQAARHSEVLVAIESRNVVLMAALWLDRRDHLTSERCDESVRDMNLLTPELAHAAHAEGLPFNWILVVRTLKGSKSLFTATSIMLNLARAKLQIEDLRFALEVKQRAASRSTAHPANEGLNRAVVADAAQSASGHSSAADAPPVPARAPNAEAMSRGINSGRPPKEPRWRSRLTFVPS